MVMDTPIMFMIRAKLCATVVLIWAALAVGR